MDYNYLPIDHNHTDLSQVANLLQFKQYVSITFAAHDRIVRCREYLDQKLAGTDDSFYGINTGFGYLQNIRINNGQLESLQSNLLQSHACGMGEEVPAEIVRLMIVFKIKSLSYGYSGITIPTVKRLIEMYNNDVLPVVYTQGSLGASGDLAPLSHLSLPLIGLGDVNFRGQRMTSKDALRELNWEPLHLKSKEGLALINGTQFMSAYGMHNLLHCRRLMQWANVIAAISYDAFDCSMDPLHEKIHSIRAHTGQVAVAASLMALLVGSEMASKAKSQVQDPYSFRCIPQVHGATHDIIEYAGNIFTREINSVTDNPNIFPADDLILSGGNFHGQPLALVLDYLAMAMSELASISERRTYQLISGQRDLPLFLIKNPGLHSGLMIPQYTAASIVSENKQLCSPSSIDTIPSSNNQEDHVSMGANAATKCRRVIANVEKVLAIELLTAVQAFEYRRPMKTSRKLEHVIESFRKVVKFNDADIVLHNEMKKSIAFLQDYSLNEL